MRYIKSALIFITCMAVLFSQSTMAGEPDQVQQLIEQIVVFYGSNSWAYTRLGHIDLSQEEMTDLLGNGDVTITLIED